MLLLPWSVAGAHASSIDYAIHDDKVSVVLSLQFFQNATSMPNLNVTFTGQPAQNLTIALEESLRKKISNISVSSLSGGLASAKGWINSTVRFEVAGASGRKGDSLIVNCSWIPFNVSRDLRLGNLSYNLIGATHVKPAFQKYVDYDKPPLNETISNVAYLSGKDEVSARLAVDKAGNATLLDFRNLAASVQGWYRTYDLTKDATKWINNPGPAVDLTMTVTPRNGTSFVVHAFYSYNATVSLDGLAQAEGDTVRIDAYGGFKALLMLAVIVVSFAVAVMASWSYRSRRRQMPRRRK